METAKDCPVFRFLTKIQHQFDLLNYKNMLKIDLSWNGTVIILMHSTRYHAGINNKSE